MNITRAHFASVLPQVESAIKRASFLAVDCEFSGLHAAEKWHGLQSCQLDPPALRYLQLRDGVEQFQLMQLGLCTFEDINGRLEARPFNIPVYPPHSNSRNGLDARFAAQASSLKFLRQHGFDFNAWIDESVPFMNRPQEQEARRLLEQQMERLARNMNEEVVPSRPFDVKYVEELKAKLAEFIANTADGDKATAELQLETSNSFQRLLAYQEVRRTEVLQCEKLTQEGKSSRYMTLRVSFAESPVTVEERIKQSLEIKRAELEANLQADIGARLVFDLMAESGKPVVVHNGLLDLMHLYSAFVEPLPQDPETWRAKMHSILPKVVDTKCFIWQNRAVTSDLPSTALSDLADSSFCRDQENVHFADGFDRYDFTFRTAAEQHIGTDNNAAAHEAGFDAFVTGAVYAGISASLDKNDELPSSQEATQKVLNRVNIVFNRYEFPLDCPVSAHNHDNTLFLSCTMDNQSLTKKLLLEIAQTSLQRESTEGIYVQTRSRENAILVVEDADAAVMATVAAAFESKTIAAKTFKQWLHETCPPKRERDTDVAETASTEPPTKKIHEPAVPGAQ
ncbi:MAG: hypothetical protein MHM6MM_003929 [Cercozoa sp. M6MM]